MATKKIDPNDPLGVSPLDAKLMQLKLMGNPPTAPRPNFRTKTVLTLPLISMAHRDMLMCQVLEEPKPADFELGPDNTKPPMLVRVLDLDTMTQALLVCNALVLSALERAGGLLTGRYFKFISGEMRDGKQFKYREIRAEEMEIDNG